MKKIFFLLLFTSSLFAVTVGDATVAYARLNTSIIAYTASVKAAKKTQEEINADLDKEIKTSRAMVYATVKSIGQLKTLYGEQSSFVDFQAATNNQQSLRNEVDLIYSSYLNEVMMQEDIKNIGK